VKDDKTTVKDGCDLAMGLPATLAPKPYLSVKELSELTPFTEPAIRTMMVRGVFKKGVHYFEIGSRRVFKWAAVVDLIEGRGVDPVCEDRIPLTGGGYLGEPEKT
jgi:hypothetical protein